MFKPTMRVMPLAVKIKVEEENLNVHLKNEKNPDESFLRTRVMLTSEKSFFLGVEKEENS